MAYLRQAFSSFDDFAKSIELLRSSSFESRSNKRWSSKFVFQWPPVDGDDDEDAFCQGLREAAKVFAFVKHELSRGRPTSGNA